MSELQNKLDNIKTQKDTLLIPDNIRKGVTILGVTGTHDSTKPNYNVYAQRTEPQKKDGVWIRQNHEIDNIYFSNTVGGKGEFIDKTSYSGITSVNRPLGQIIINSKLYSVDSYSGSGFTLSVYNLKTKSKETSSYCAATMNTTYLLRMFEHNGNIFIFFRNSTCRYTIYNPSTNTFSPVKDTGMYQNETDLYWWFLLQNGNRVYSYFKAWYHYSSNVQYFDLDTETLVSIGDWGALGQSYSSHFITATNDGPTFYALSATGSGTPSVKLVRGTLGTLDATTISGVPAYGYIHLVDDKLFLFPSGSNKTQYYIYDTVNNVWDTKTTQIPFSMVTTIGYTTSEQQLAYDNASGLLYSRFINNGMNIFQLGGAPEIEDLEDGTIVIAQSFAGNKTKILDDDNLHIGVSDTFVVETVEGEKQLNGEHLTYWGDSEKWNLLKNGSGETVPVTFNTDGGSAVVTQDVPIGSKAVKPTNPTKADYVFDTWYLGDEIYDFNSIVLEPITLTAHWEEFDEIDWLGSTGTQYIDTGIVPTENTKTICDFAITDTRTATDIYPAMYETQNLDNSSDYRNYGLEYTPSNKTVRGRSGLTTGTSYPYTINTKYHSELDSANWILDGVPQEFTFEWKGSPTATLSLFARHSAQGGFNTNHRAYCKIYSFQLYENDVLVRDYIPIRTSRGVLAMYDRVENKPYYNGGTGTFTWGYRHEITYNVDGGSAVASIEVDSGDKIPEPITRKEGYVPAEWLYNGEHYDFNVAIPTTYPRQMTLNVRWSTYTEVAYVQSNGTAYVDTGVYWSQSKKADVDFQLTKIPTSDAAIIGAWEANKGAEFGVRSTGVFQSAFATSSWAGTTLACDMNEHIVVIDCVNKIITFDGATFTTSTATTAFDYTAKTIHLFRANGGAGVSLCKIYSAKFYDNDTLIRDYIPIKLADGTYCMLDNVNNKVYYNAGTGILMGEGYTPVVYDYIQSSGSQYLDTGLTPAQVGRIKTAFIPMTVSSDWAAVVGTERNGSPYNTCAIRINTTKHLALSFGEGTSMTVNDYIAEPKVEYVIDYNANEGYTIINGESYTASIGTVAPGNLFMFALNVWTSSSSHSIGQYSRIQLEYMQFYNRNGVMIYDFVPCEDYDGIICLWDRITGIFLRNSGTGAFDAGYFREVTFNANGGTPSSVTIPVAINSTCNPPSTIVKDGYYADYWTLNGEPFDFTTPVSNDITLTAHWSPSIMPANVDKYFTTTNGTYSFAWVNDYKYYKTNNGAKGSTTASTVLTAKGPITGKVKYEYGTQANYDKFTFKAAGVTVLNAVSGVGAGEYEISLAEGQKLEFSYSKNSSTDANGDYCAFNIYPTEVNVYTVTFNTAGGSIVDSQEVFENWHCVKPTDPSKTDYIFAGWYLDDEVFDFDTPITEDITLTAVWETYTELDYIESTGTQYIDTGILPILNTRLVVDGQFESLDVGRFGSYGDVEAGRRFYFGVVNSQWIVGYGAGEGGYNHTVGTADMNRHTFEINNTDLLIDNVSKYSYTRSWSSTQYNICLFAMSSSYMPPVEHFAKAKCYSAKIYQNDTLVRDYIPVITTVSHRIGLFDQVSGALYENQGTGSFIGSNEVTVTFDSDGGSAVAPQTIRAGEKCTKPEKPTKEGFMFSGWLQNGDIFNFAEPVTESIILTALWKEYVGYVMLYDAGDECLGVTGGWDYHRLTESSDSKDVDFSSHTFTKNSDNIYVKGVHNSNKNSKASIYTVYPIELEYYSKILYRTSPNDHGPGTQVYTALLNQNPTKLSDAIGLGGVYATNTSSSTLTTNKPLYLANVNRSDSKSVGVVFTSNGWYGDISFYLYSVMLLRQDDWQSLCTIAGLDPEDYTDDADLCANSTAMNTILSDSLAVNYMITKCTGTFAGAFITSQVALTALNTSEYKSEIYANPDWNKFLGMIPS